jgi:hypothetical protein
MEHPVPRDCRWSQPFRARVISVTRDGSVTDADEGARVFVKVFDDRYFPPPSPYSNGYHPDNEAFAQTEAAVYSTLQQFQGTQIPWFYGIVKVSVRVCDRRTPSHTLVSFSFQFRAADRRTLFAVVLEDVRLPSFHVVFPPVRFPLPPEGCLSLAREDLAMDLVSVGRPFKYFETRILMVLSCVVSAAD